jgi:hypothetical protein
MLNKFGPLIWEPYTANDGIMQAKQWELVSRPPPNGTNLQLAH